MLAPVTDANGSVEEMRYEYFAIHNWRIDERMSLESTQQFEGSTITQRVNVYQSRDVNFLRPKIDGNSVSYDIDRTEIFHGALPYFSWIEVIAWGGLTYRFEARDSKLRCRTRNRFENLIIGDSGLREIEKSCWTEAATLALKVRATF